MVSLFICTINARSVTLQGNFSGIRGSIQSAKMCLIDTPGCVCDEYRLCPLIRFYDDVLIELRFSFSDDNFWRTVKLTFFIFLEIS